MMQVAKRAIRCGVDIPRHAIIATGCDCFTNISHQEVKLPQSISPEHLKNLHFDPTGQLWI